MSVSQIDKTIFADIKSCCIELSQVCFLPTEISHTAESSKKLTQLLQRVYDTLKSSISKFTNDSSRLQLNYKLADYVFVPIEYLLKQRSSFTDAQTGLILNIINLLIYHCWYIPINTPTTLLSQLFPLIIYLIDLDTSVETKLAGVTSLYSLCQLPSTTAFFQDTKNKPLLGKLITQILEFSLIQNAVQLQLKCLDLLLLLYTSVIDDGELLSYILPGNISSLTKLIAQKNGITTHYTVLVKLIQIIDQLVVKVFNDSDLGTVDKKHDVHNIQQLIKLSQEPIDEAITIPTTTQTQHRTTSWLHATSNQIKLAVPIITSLKDHHRYEVRHSLAELCQSIIQKCSISLAPCTPMIIDCISFLDELPMTQLMSPSILDTVRQKFTTKISLLPSTLSSSNQDKIIQDLKSMSFYLTFSTELSLEQLVTTLHGSIYNYISAEITTTRFKNKNIQSLTKQDSISNELTTLQRNITDTSDMYLFEKFYDSNVESELMNLLNKIGQSHDAIPITLSQMGESPLSKAISLWMINNMIQHPTDDLLITDAEPDSDTMYDLIGYATELLEETPNADLVNSMIQSIALDSIGQLCTVLQSDFQTELIDCLYPVIDSLASSNDKIRSHAQKVSLTISQVCYQGSVRDLIFENCDYLVDSLSLKLTSDSITPRTSAVLMVLIKIGGMELISQLQDIIHTMFTLLDLYHGYDNLSEGFFVVFNSIIDEIYTTYLKDYDFHKETNNVENYNKPWGMTNIEQVIAIIDTKQRDLDVLNEDIPLVKHPNRPFGDVPDSDDEDDEEDNEMALMKEMDNYQLQKQKQEQQKWDSHIPKNLYFIIQQFLSYGDRLILSTDSIRLQSRILEVIRKVIPILSTSSLNLLPIIADIWPLVLRLSVDEDIRVLGQAITVARTIIEFGGDFMSQKFEQMWVTLKTESNLFKEFTVVKSENLMKFQGNLNYKIYYSVLDTLVFGISKLGPAITPTTLKEIIDRCIMVFPDDKLYGYYSDIAWLVNYERTGRVDTTKPDDILLSDGTAFTFYTFT